MHPQDCHHAVFAQTVKILFIWLSLTWQLLTNGSISHCHGIYPCTITSTQNSLAIITALSNCTCDVGLARQTPRSGCGLAIIVCAKFWPISENFDLRKLNILPYTVRQYKSQGDARSAAEVQRSPV